MPNLAFKLDENMTGEAARALRAAGYDVTTVVDQKLEGASDEIVASVSRDEGRCLVTLDLDFSDIVRFPPGNHAGIIVLRLPKRSSPQQMLEAVKVMIDGLQAASPMGTLWVIQGNRIRQRRAIEEL